MGHRIRMVVEAARGLIFVTFVVVAMPVFLMANTLALTGAPPA